MIDRKGQAPADQILHHAKAAFRAINRQTRFSQRQGFDVMHALGGVAAVLFDPLEVLATVNPISEATRTLPRRKIRLKFFRNEFR
jgi:hypothetical protein